MSNITKRLNLRLSPSDHRRLAQLLDEFGVVLALVGPACGARAGDLALDVERAIWRCHIGAADAVGAPTAQGRRHWTSLDARNFMRGHLGLPPISGFRPRRRHPFEQIERFVVRSSLDEMARRLADLGAERPRRKVLRLRRMVHETPRGYPGLTR